MKNITLTHPDYISNEEIKIGDVFHDNYEIVSAPRVTENGTVWKIRHKRWDADLRMTRPDPALFADMTQTDQSGVVSAYQRVFIPMQLHPRIEAFYDVRHIGGGTAFFTEWTTNGSLADCMANGSLYQGGEETVATRLRRIAGQLARGLQYLASENLRHGAVTAANVILTDRWNAKLSVANPTTLSGRGEDDKASWALTVLEMYLGHPIVRDPEEIVEHYLDYKARMRVSLPSQLELTVLNALNGKLVNWQYVFLYLQEPLTREYGVCTAALEMNHALRLIDCGKTADAWNELCQLIYLTSGDPQLACYNLMTLGQELDAHSRSEAQKLYHQKKGEPYQMLLSPQLHDRRELTRIMEVYRDDLPEVLRQYLPALQDCFNGGSAFRAPYLHWQRIHPYQSGEDEI